MLVKFHYVELEEIFEEKATYNFHPDVIKMYRRRVEFLKEAEDIRDLKQRRSLKYERLFEGKFAWLYSIRINDQWRLVFDRTKEGCIEVLDLYEISKHYE